MTKTEYLEQICTNLGIDVSKFPDRLLSTFLAAISNRLGVMKDNGTLDEYLSVFTGGNNGDTDGSYDEGYAEGFEAGKEQGGGGGDTYGEELETLFSVAPFLKKVSFTYSEDWSMTMSCGAIVGRLCDTYGHVSTTLIVVPPWVTEIDESGFDNFTSDSPSFVVIFPTKTPPVIGAQGMWADWGGNCPPSAIFVPDESIEAYKNTENLTEFAHLMKPLSEYNGEGYYGGNA